MKVLIVYAKAGAGHLRAAEAVYSAFKRNGQEADATLIDCLDYTSPWFKNFYPQVYIILVRYFSFIWKLIYYTLDKRLVYALVRPFRRLTNSLSSGRFEQFLKKENPKVIISTQFFASEVIANLKKRGEINSTIISVVTDFGAHTFWESEDIDIFIAASEDTKQDLLTRRIPEEKIKVLGIPIELPLQRPNRVKAKEAVGLKRDLFTVLIAGGGFGVGPIKEVVFSLDKLEDRIKANVQVVVVCSRNKKLYKEIENIAAKLKLNIKILGFVPDLYKMMVASNVIISKSGGLTTSESLAAGLPMLIIAPIPGQESKNCDLLVTRGAAIRIDRAQDVKQEIEDLFNMPDKLTQMHKQALLLSRPYAADDLVELANNYLV
ncbi:glycosyltransferase [Candidatus Omnitrophota bacterium]